MVHLRSRQAFYNKGTSNFVAQVNSEDNTTLSEEEEQQLRRASPEVKPERYQNPVKRKAGPRRGIRRAKKRDWYHIKSRVPKPERKQQQQRSRRKPEKHRQVPEFFKVYIPELSAERFRIPLSFMDKHKKVIRERVILKDASGETCYIDVQRTPDAVYLTRGWSKFIEDHDVKVGEFLVFTYLGYYTFGVKIFGTDGCGRNFEPNSVTFAYEKDVIVKDESSDDFVEEPVAAADEPLMNN